MKTELGTCGISGGNVQSCDFSGSDVAIHDNQHSVVHRRGVRRL